MIELDNTMLLFIGSENYSGKKIPWTEMSVRVRFPPEAQKNINIQKNEIWKIQYRKRRR